MKLPTGFSLIDGQNRGANLVQQLVNRPELYGTISNQSRTIRHNMGVIYDTRQSKTAK